MKTVYPKLATLILSGSLLFSPMIPANTMHVSEDAYIDLAIPNDNPGGVPNLVVSNQVDKRTGERMTFMAFDVLDLPAGASLEEAYLRVHVGKVESAGMIDLYLVLEPWDEHSISAATVPGFEPLPFTSVPIDAQDMGHFILVDVTPEVNAWLDGATDNYGIAFRANPGSRLNVSFDSKENPQTSHQSELELVLGVAEGGVDSEDIADESIMSEDIKDGTVGAADVDKSAVQLRVSGSCATGSSIRVIDELGAVTCEPDDDSGGDITSVFPVAGGGLTGGASSGDAELGVAPNGIISSMIANGTIVAADVDENSIQRRVLASCPPGQSIRAISASGGVTCEVDDDTPDTTLDPDSFWKIGGNAGTSPIPGGSHFVGTSDNTELVLGANGTQALRLSQVSTPYFETINVLGGHPMNQIVNAYGATIGGGGYRDLGAGIDHPNIVEAAFGTIGGGEGNTVGGNTGFIGGGSRNTVEGGFGFIGGGSINKISMGIFATIGGGASNESFRPSTFIGGGTNNSICAPDLFPPEEFSDTDGEYAVIVGGVGNRSCGYLSFIGGGGNNRATGEYSMVIGGRGNEAVGDYSQAAGNFAAAEHRGSFVWADAYNFTKFPSLREHQMRVRATGGARFDVGSDAGSIPAGNQWVDIRAQGLATVGPDPVNYRLIDTSTGAYLSLGGGWVNASDRERKTDIRDVDASWILEQVVAMPVQSWRYKVDSEGVRHIGPMAQDFYATFGFGGDPKGIMSVDADGVALAAIQALYQVTQKLEERTAQLEAQQLRIDALEAAFAGLKLQFAPSAGERLLASSEK